MQSTATAKRLPLATQIAIAARAGGAEVSATSLSSPSLSLPSSFTVKWMRGSYSTPIAEGSELFLAAVRAALGTGLQSIYTTVRVPHNGEMVTCRVYEKEVC